MIIIGLVVMVGLILAPYIMAEETSPELEITQAGCWILFIAFVFLRSYSVIFLPITAVMFMAVGQRENIARLYYLGIVIFLLSLLLDITIYFHLSF